MRALKPFIKKILRSDVVLKIACWLAAMYIRLVWYTGKWEIKGLEHINALYDKGQPCIVCFWHGRLLMASYGWQREKPFNMLISAHRDGMLIAHTVKHLGIGHITGSSSKGGSTAFRAVLKALKAGEYVGITPDGPRGPRMRISDGVLSIARLSGAPIVPITFGIRAGKILGSWDRFLLALPFSRGVIQWGAPVVIPKDADNDAIDAARMHLEQHMNKMIHDVDIETGRTPVEPAPPFGHAS